MLMERAPKSKRKGLLTEAKAGASVGMACCTAAYSACTLGGTMGVSRSADWRPQGICINSLESPLPQMVRAPTMTKMTVQDWRMDHKQAGGKALARRPKTTEGRISAGSRQGEALPR